MTGLSKALRSRSLLRLAMLATSLLAIALPILSPLLISTAAAASPQTPAAAAASPLKVTLTAITPTVAVPGAPIRITGRVHNSGGASVPAPIARALIGQRPLAGRQAVSDWAASKGEQPLTLVASNSLGKTLAPGSVTAFTLVIAAKSISHLDSFAVLPLRIEVVGAGSTTTEQPGNVHTFLPTLAAVKAFEPLSIAWIVPLTLDPDPALHSTPGPARTAAWAKAIGPGSRLLRLIQGTQNARVTWAIDPAVLGPRQLPAATAEPAETSPTPSATQPPAQDSTATVDPVTVQTGALAARLKAAAPRHTLWSLPYADPDLTALLSHSSGNSVLSSLISRSSSLDVPVASARTDIAWPVAGTLTPQTQTRLRHAFAAPGLTAAVTSASALATLSGSTDDASRRSSTGLPLLAYDEALSRTVAQTSSKAAGAITIQRFLADTMALLGERPGTRNRSVLIAEPRTFAGDPAVLRSLFAAVDKAPWLKAATTGQLLEASKKLPPEVPGTAMIDRADPAKAPSATRSPTAADPLSPGTSPLTSATLATLPGIMSSIEGIASILADGRTFTTSWTDAQAQKLSTRWRDHPRGFAALEADTMAAVRNTSGKVRVSPSSVNFFADRGVLQVTVVNELDVPIHDVRLSLTPAQPRLQIERQPGPLKIGAKSRANVPLHVTSIAAGLVRVDAVLTTPNGTPLGQTASVNVRVQPPSTWIYWVLGGLAGVVLVLGTYRSLRRGSTRASRPDPQEPPLHA
jgi:hypothetical protein